MDITNPAIIAPFIAECLHRHKRRHDFRRMIIGEGFREHDYRQLLTDESNLYEIAGEFAVRLAETISNREVPVFTTTAERRIDTSCGKVRLIGSECPEQRLYDYIAVKSCGELWKRKLLPQQCASIKGRGQVYGVKLLRHYILRDNRAMKYAVKHHLRYTRKCKYFVKLDIRHCYESIDRGILYSKILHDVGNTDITYLWHQLLLSYASSTNGLLIGALPSQYASQYVIANIIRKADENEAVTHAMTYMDDICLFSSNRRKLLKAVHQLIDYAAALCLTIKPNFHIKKLAEEPIDMMGYVVHANGKVTIRAKAFLRARRQVLRYEQNGGMSYEQAKRLASYKGMFLHSNCHYIFPRFNKAFEKAQRIVGRKEKRNGMGVRI